MVDDMEVKSTSTSDTLVFFPQPVTVNNIQAASKIHVNLFINLI